MTFKIRRFVQVLFLVAFTALFVLGKVQMWMVIFSGGVAAAAFFGRFYCGWMCPINTLMEAVGWTYKKLGVKHIKVPGWLKMPIIRYGILALFLVAMVFIQVSGKKLPVIVILAAAGWMLSLVFEPALWHRYLCPYGTLLSITGSFAKRHWKVENESCIKCGLCKKACPAEAIKMENKEFPVISKALCIECLSSVKACPKNTIKYS